MTILGFSVWGFLWLINSQGQGAGEAAPKAKFLVEIQWGSLLLCLLGRMT